MEDSRQERFEADLEKTLVKLVYKPCGVQEVHTCSIRSRFVLVRAQRVGARFGATSDESDN